jgi:hypothetical protein
LAAFPFDILLSADDVDGVARRHHGGEVSCCREECVEEL